MHRRVMVFAACYYLLFGLEFAVLLYTVCFVVFRLPRLDSLERQKAPSPSKAVNLPTNSSHFPHASLAGPVSFFVQNHFATPHTTTHTACRLLVR